MAEGPARSHHLAEISSCRRNGIDFVDPLIRLRMLAGLYQKSFVAGNPAKLLDAPRALRQLMDFAGIDIHCPEAQMFVVTIHDASIRFVALPFFFVLGFRFTGEERDLLTVRRPLEALNRVLGFS